MAILKSVIPVNNGNTGWSKKDVLDALETVFANLGWHGGTSVNGVPQGCIAPGINYTNASSDSISILNSNWKKCGGTPPSIISTKDRYFYVENQGTTAYRILEQIVFSYNEARSDTDQIYDPRHGLQTGDALLWAPGGTLETANINGLTLNTVYYAIKVDDDYFKLASTSAAATAGTAIDLLPGGYQTNIASKSNSVYRFRRLSNSAYDNYTIDVLVGDRLFFDILDTSDGKFFLCHQSNSYQLSKVINQNNFGSVSHRTMPSNNVGIADVNTQGYIEWDTGGWAQSEDEAYTPTTLKHPEYPTGVGFDGVTKYIYASDTHSGMKGEIRLLPSITNKSSSYYRYWKYTIPASGGRSELKLRIHRDPTTSDRNIVGIAITNLGSGWSANETFTIPGTAVGGVSPTNDIIFGVNTNETSTGAKNGIASVRVTNLGGGSNFYQKHDNGYFAILKNINSPSKKFGTTYYGFGMDNNNNYDMVIQSGSGWNLLNVNGTTAANSNGQYDYGSWTGYNGLDYGTEYLPTTSSVGYTAYYKIRYATTSTPTAYPLSIRVYRAQAPQDTNFAIIQFTQTINGVIQPYGTFTIHKGIAYGSGVWDLDNVFLGSATEYSVGNRSISLSTGVTGQYYSYYSNDSATREGPVTNSTRAREAFYGYARQATGSNYLTTSTYEANIDTTNGETNVIYYRNSAYDAKDGYSVNSAANYYKPIKGIPIADKYIPCPYYLPDDFVLLQVSTSPGLTQFRPGDTVTISASEVYEVVLGGYQTQQNSLDDINDNSTIGMLLLARTT